MSCIFRIPITDGKLNMGTWQVTKFTSNDLPIDVLGQHTLNFFLKTLVTIEFEYVGWQKIVIVKNLLLFHRKKKKKRVQNYMSRLVVPTLSMWYFSTTFAFHTFLLWSIKFPSLHGHLKFLNNIYLYKTTMTSFRLGLCATDIMTLLTSYIRRKSRWKTYFLRHCLSTM